jgi:hypothetical protein
MPYFKTKRYAFADLLSGVTATGASATKTVLGDLAVLSLRYFIKATGITTGGTVLIEGSHDGTNWYPLATAAISATGNTTGVVTGPVGKYWRVNLSARTDGTYSVAASLVYQP